MTTYAKETTVSVDKTRQDIEAALRRYGADAFGYAVDDAARQAVIQFRVHGRLMRLDVPLPDPSDKALRPKANNQHTGSRNAVQAQRDGYEQALRQRWRALYLYVRAALEAVENGLMTLDRALLHAVVLPNGRTIGEMSAPQIEAFVLRGEVPALLPGGGA